MTERLTVRVLLKPEEGLYQYLARTAAINGFDRITMPDALRPSISMSDHYFRSKELAHHTGLTEGEARKLLPRRVSLDAIEYYGAVLPSESLNLKSTKVCADCLSGAQTSWTWQLRALEVCPTHRQRLVDRCRRCVGPFAAGQCHFECTSCAPSFEELDVDHSDEQFALQLSSLCSRVSQQSDALSDWLFAWRYVSRAAVRSRRGRDLAKKIVVGSEIPLPKFAAFTAQLVDYCKPSPSDSAWARDAKLRLRHLARVSNESLRAVHLADLPYVPETEVSIQPVLPGLEAFISEAEAERVTGLRGDDLLSRYETHLGGALEENDDGQLEFDVGAIAQIEQAETKAGNISRRSGFRGGMTHRALAEHLGLTVRDLRQLCDAGLLVHTHNGRRSQIEEQSWRALLQYMREISVFHKCDLTEYDSSRDEMSLSKFRERSRVGILQLIASIEQNDIECVRYSDDINSFYDLYIDAKPFVSNLRRRSELPSER